MRNGNKKYFYCIYDSMSFNMKISFTDTTNIYALSDTHQDTRKTSSLLSQILNDKQENSLKLKRLPWVKRIGTQLNKIIPTTPRIYFCMDKLKFFIIPPLILCINFSVYFFTLDLERIFTLNWILCILISFEVNKKKQY